MSFLFPFFLLPCRFQMINGQRDLLACNSCRISHSVALDRTCFVYEERCTWKHGREYWGSSTNGLTYNSLKSCKSWSLGTDWLKIKHFMPNVQSIFFGECWRILLSWNGSILIFILWKFSQLHILVTTGDKTNTTYYFHETLHCTIFQYL